jgi:Phosphatidylinositol N-acetylglucosaminyltransferase
LSSNSTATQLATSHWRSRSRLCSNAVVVVVQEFALSSWLLARRRLVQQERRYPDFLVSASTWLMFFAMVITIAYSTVAESAAASAAAASANAPPQSHGAKARKRTLDAMLVAVLLPFTAQVLPSLTASYSTDTVERLAGLGLLVHLLCCDYSFANGLRPPACTPPQSPSVSSIAPHEGTTSTSTVTQYQRLWLSIRVVVAIVHRFMVVPCRSMPCVLPRRSW